MMAMIGRFQLFHEGHREVVKQALDRAQKVNLMVGSSNVARDTRNPFTYVERARMIRAALVETLGEDTVNERVIINALPDSPYDLEKWIETVQSIVAMNSAPFVRPKVGLTGHERDHSSYYLDLFPQWPFQPAGIKVGDVSASQLRAAYFSLRDDLHDRSWRDKGPVWPDVVPAATLAFMEEFRETEHFERLMKDYAAELRYHAEWGHMEPHLTADAVVIQSGHVLIIERGGEYGYGMRAMPGGFLEKKRKETLLQASYRECFEETSLFIETDIDHFGSGYDIKVDGISKARYQRLLPHLRGRELFDDPNRSRRGAIVTQAHIYKLPDGPLPRVIAADDAKDAYWLPISEIKTDEFFEDHAAIIEKMIRTYL